MNTLAIFVLVIIGILFGVVFILSCAYWFMVPFWIKDIKDLLTQIRNNTLPTD